MVPQHDSTWFCFYDDFFRHPKARRLNNDQQRVVFVCWAIASRSPVRGVLMITNSLQAVYADIADESRLPEETVKEAIGTPQAPGIVAQDHMFLAWRPDGILFVPNWDEMQFTMKRHDPTNAERQSRSRAKKKEQPKSTGEVTLQ